jgi:hypothetical protein
LTVTLAPDGTALFTVSDRFEYGSTHVLGGGSAASEKSLGLWDGLKSSNIVSPRCCVSLGSS